LVRILVSILSLLNSVQSSLLTLLNSLMNMLVSLPHWGNWQLLLLLNATL
jgi:hypothetical protein